MSTIIQEHQPKISVVTPAYRRPDYLRELIESFLKQSYKNSELVISDDSSSDTRVQILVQEYTRLNSNIVYIKNEENLGFCKNLLKSIMNAHGDYILIMGDDDILVNENTLSTYVNIFETNKNIGYVYANQIQFTKDLRVDYIYKHFDTDQLFETTEKALKKPWLLSCFISGIGLRNYIDFEALYPKDNILFPQVELIGKILGEYQAYGISKYLIGARAHDQQLGFAAVKNQNIKDNEKHSVYELNTVYKNVINYYKDELHKPFVVENSFVNEFFEQKHMTIFPSEKINTNNSAIIKVFYQAVKNNPNVLFNITFVTYFLVSLILPAKILYKLKEWKKHQYVSKFPDQIKSFNQFVTWK